MVLEKSQSFTACGNRAYSFPSLLILKGKRIDKEFTSRCECAINNTSMKYKHKSSTNKGRSRPIQPQTARLAQIPWFLPKAGILLLHTPEIYNQEVARGQPYRRVTSCSYRQHLVSWKKRYESKDPVKNIVTATKKFGQKQFLT